MKSDGKFEHVRPFKAKKAKPTDVDDSSDAYDTIDWLVRNVPGNNGRVGVWGISYPGFYTANAMIDAHPALKAVSPQAPVMDFFDVPATVRASFAVHNGRDDVDALVAAVRRVREIFA